MKKVAVPEKIRLEASSVCQLRCPLCPTTRNSTVPAIGKGFLSLKDFQSLIDQNAGIKKVELSNYGEIFLNPDLLEIMQYAFKRKVLLTADNGANLNLINTEVLEGLVKYKFGSITCSIDGARQESYAKYRVGGNYDTVIRNIISINKLKRKYSTPYPILSWQFILFKHNEHELLHAKGLAKRLGMYFHPKVSWDREWSPASSDITKKVFGGILSREDFQNKYSIDYMRHICHQLWDSPQINWDGRLLGCCRNFWGDFGVNVFEVGLQEALNSEFLNNAKEMLLGRRKMIDDVPCAACDIYLNMKKSRKWLDRGFRKKVLIELSKYLPIRVKRLVKELHYRSVNLI